LAVGARLKVDEDLPLEVCELPSSAGHDARTVHDQDLTGVSDDELWLAAQREQGVLLTADRGFGNALKYRIGSHAGIVLFRHPREGRAAYVALTEQLVARMDLSEAPGAIVVISPQGIRVHRRPPPVPESTTAGQ
jgi:predicted nuclease of predicted toxin-antitoxin system